MKGIQIKSSWIMFSIFMGLIVLLGVGLSLDPRFLPSKLIEKPFPQFSLSRLNHPQKTVQQSDLMGRPGLVHIWATWCGVCLSEHEDLMQIASKWPYPIYSVLYQDNPEQAAQWLHSKGNPYVWTAIDNKGRLGLDLGVYGTPETYVLDAKGIIRYRVVGPLTVRKFEREILPLFKSFREEGASA